MTRAQQQFNLKTAYLGFKYYFDNPDVTGMISEYYYLKFGINLDLSPELLKEHTRVLKESDLEWFLEETSGAVLEKIRSSVLTIQ